MFFAGERAIDMQDLKDLKSTRDVFSLARTMARDRPSPYGEGGRFFIGSRGPSEVSIRASERVSPALSIVPMCVSPAVVCARLSTNGSGSGTGRALLHGFMKHPQLYMES